jgi:hypothetical protein
MADNLFNVGTPMSAEDYLKIISFMNKRESDDNRLIRGLGTLTGVTTSNLTSSGLDTALRRYSTANDEEITAKIIYGMADGDYKTEKEYVREYKRRNYPLLFMEKALAEWRRTKGREESAATAAHARKMEPGAYTSQQQTIAKEEQRIKDADIDEAMIAVVKRAAEDDIQAIRDGKKYHAVVRDRLTKESAGWEPNHQEYYKSLMAMADQKPKATPTTKQVHNKRTGEDLWMTEDEIAAENKANPGSIVPLSAKEPDPTQVSNAMAQAAAKVLYDPNILSQAGVDEETATILIDKWGSDRSWMVRFTEIAPEHKKLHKAWYNAVEDVMKWYMSGPPAEGSVID